MSAPRLRHLQLTLTLLLSLGLPAQVVCPQNAVKPAGDAVAKAKPAAAPAPTAKTKSNDLEDDRLTIEHADKLRKEPNVELYHLTGNVVFVNKDSRLYCDEAVYDADKDTARATGHLKATNPDNIITGDLMEADFGKKFTVVTGHVTVVTEKKRNKHSSEAPVTALRKSGKQQGTTDQSAPNANPTAPPDTAVKEKNKPTPSRVSDFEDKKTTITCERLEYYYDDNVKKMIATPRVKIVQEDKTVWADQAVYEDLPGLITLSGNVILTTDKGDELHCTKATVAVDDDWVEAEGVSGVTSRKNRKSEKKPAPQPAGPTVAPPPPTAAPAKTKDDQE